MKEIKQIIKAYDTACVNGQQTALATVVHVEGASYRGPGARMLVNEDGTLTGAISGGCLEGDALRKALMAIVEKRPLLATYDTSDEGDAIFGIGLGCNGIIRVLIEPIDPADSDNAIELLKEATRIRKACLIATFFSLHDKWNPLQGTHLLIRPDKTRFESGKLPVSMEVLQHDFERSFEYGSTRFVNYGTADSTAPNTSLTAIYEYLQPAISLVIAGAGNDIFPLVTMADILGWEVTLIDGRPSHANESRFPSCRIVVSDAGQALDNLTLDDRTAVVLITHNYNYDKDLLGILLKKDQLPYIGMLGPKKKKESMLTALQEVDCFWDEHALDRLYSPVGLDIGAETSEEIALSVIAEIKTVFARRQGASLRSYSGKIHDRNERIINAATKAFLEQ
ncbi:XdhC family protein [Olivibacter sp. XZL3]|uniref:XdhC family protein n=1 Tax=Olivibacter sp. XZL3 TaxID=1735116 RepID=UPI0010652649|nr:XdhC/CoxI family protein [Olivibacter sp. XZL3]